MVQFASNFSQSLPLFNDDGVENDFSDNGIIQIYLDQTDLQITSFMQQKLYESYKKFTENLMVDCKKSKKAGSSPIDFEAAFGKLGFHSKTSMVSGILLG